MTKPSASKQDYVDAAKICGAPLDIFYAICLKESRHAGFMPDGFPTCLYEPHIIWRHATDAQRQILQPLELAYPRWGTAPYGTYAAQEMKFKKCRDLADIDLAIMGTSFGLLQILGENYHQCGFVDSNAFFMAMLNSEADQLDAAAHLMFSKGMQKGLQTYNFRDIALRWNGSGNVDAYAKDLQVKLLDARHLGYV